MRTTILCIFCVLVFACPAAAKQTQTAPPQQTVVINQTFTRAFVQENAHAGKAGYERTQAFLAACSTAQLKAFKKSIESYRKSAQSTAALGIENYYTYTLIIAIEDRLGILPYNRVLEGKFIKRVNGLDKVSPVWFKSVSHKKLFELGIYNSTLLPYYEYLANFDDLVRVYVEPTGAAKHRYYAVVKLELLADNSPPIVPAVQSKDLVRAPVDEAFARQVLIQAIRDGAEGRRFVQTALDSLDRNELLLLRKIIYMDMEYWSAREAIVPHEPLATRFIGYRVLDLIDERLGLPRYNTIVEGRFVQRRAPSSSGDNIIYYSFQPVEGDVLEVQLDNGATVPLGYTVSFTENVRLFVHHPSGEIIKLERLEAAAE